MDEPTQTLEAPASVVAEDSSPVVSSPTEPTTSEPVVESQPAVETTEPERQPRPAQRRIQELVQENKQLKDQLATGLVPDQLPQAPKLSEQFAGKEQIMPDELDKLGQKVYEQGAQAARGKTGLEVAQLRQEMVTRDAINEMERDAARVESEYSELNPKDSAYNTLLEKRIADRYQREAVQLAPDGRKSLNPAVKLADLAREEVEFFRAAAEAGKAQVSQTLATQADQAGLTPTTSTPGPEKSFADMSLKEQETYLRAQGHDI